MIYRDNICIVYEASSRKAVSQEMQVSQTKSNNVGVSCF